MLVHILAEFRGYTIKDEDTRLHIDDDQCEIDFHDQWLASMNAEEEVEECQIDFQGQEIIRKPPGCVSEENRNRE